jgi:hypothetical protein
MNQKQEKLIRNFFVFVGLLSLLVFAGYQMLPSLLIKENNQNVENAENLENIPTQQIDLTNSGDIPIINLSLGNTEPTPEVTQQPTKALLNAPFTSQAPTGVWDELHNAACEEASLIMADAYLKGTKLDSATAEKQIQEMVDWQIKNFGSHHDLTLAETNQLAQAYFNDQNFWLEKNITVDAIKTALNNGHVVILPMAGRLLKNPYFRSPGPYYHMLLVIGYDGNKFITNDPGTKRGEHYVYSADVLFNALHDWPGEGNDIATGAKNMLVVEP